MICAIPYKTPLGNVNPPERAKGSRRLAPYVLGTARSFS
jgi:hypothetical protein